MSCASGNAATLAATHYPEAADGYHPARTRRYGTITAMPTFPSMRARDLQRMLERELGYSVEAQRGSHKKMRSTLGHLPVTFAFHDGVEIAPGLVRKILTTDVGLSLEDAAHLLGLR